jgi:glutamine synthetase
MPSISSYRRCGDFQAGTKVSWGTQNRQTPVRKLGDGYWEVRCADATANMYLAVAAILGAGLLGSRNEEPLHWEDMSFSSGSKIAYEELPRTITHSLDSLEGVSDDFVEILSSKVASRYLYVKRNEVQALEGLDSYGLSQLLSKVF